MSPASPVPGSGTGGTAVAPTTGCSVCGAPADFPPFPPPSLHERRRLQAERTVRLVAWMAANSNRTDVQVTEMAQVAGVSVRRLQGIFQREFGLPPLRVLRGIGLHRAHLALTGRAPVPAGIAEAARLAGYTRVSRFKADYKARYGRYPAIPGQLPGLRSRARRTVPASPAPLPATVRRNGMSPRQPRPRRGTAAVLAVALLAATVLAATACGAPRPQAPGHPGSVTVTAACAHPGPPLGAGQLRAAYQAPPLSPGGLTGAGTVIAVIIPSAAPHVAADVAAYSARYGLPAPRVRVLSYGRVPAPAGADAAGWQQEGTLALEVAHALAPQAQLLYLAVPPGDDGNGGGTTLEDAALGWLVTRYDVTVVSYSEGIPENWDGQHGHALIASSRAGLQAAARAGTTVVAGSGDYGPDEPGPGGHLELGVLWPASDPLATAVGGTRLTAATVAGHASYASTAFSYTAATGGGGGRAGGAGLSAVFPRPPWQDPVAAVTGARRGVADISMDASRCSAVTAYTSTSDLPGQRPGWIRVAGTSVAAPLLAGVVADAAQAAGRPLGVLGPALYRLHGAADGITDVTSGGNSMPGVPGYPAGPGYDLPTGIGTVSSITLFSRALARLAGGRR